MTMNKRKQLHSIHWQPQKDKLCSVQLLGRWGGFEENPFYIQDAGKKLLINTGMVWAEHSWLVWHLAKLLVPEPEAEGTEGTLVKHNRLWSPDTTEAQSTSPAFIRSPAVCEQCKVRICFLDQVLCLNTCLLRIKGYFAKLVSYFLVLWRNSKGEWQKL